MTNSAAIQISATVPTTPTFGNVSLPLTMLLPEVRASSQAKGKPTEGRVIWLV
jgi:hypothetical protein